VVPGLANQRRVHHRPAQAGHPVSILLRLALFGAVLGGLIGAALGAWRESRPGYSTRPCGGRGWAWSSAGPASAGRSLFGQVVYRALHGGEQGAPVLRARFLLRAGAWALVGRLHRLGQGAQGAIRPASCSTAYWAARWGLCRRLPL